MKIIYKTKKKVYFPSMYNVYIYEIQLDSRYSFI